MLWKLVRNFAQRLAGDSIVSCRCSPKSLPSPPHLGSICDRDGEGSNRLVRRRGRKPLQKGELSSRDFSEWDLRRRLTASARQSSRSAAKNIPTPLMDQCASEELSVERVIVWCPNQPRPSLTRGIVSPPCDGPRFRLRAMLRVAFIANDAMPSNGCRRDVPPAHASTPCIGRFLDFFESHTRVAAVVFYVLIRHSIVD